MTNLPQNCKECPFAQHIEGDRYDCTQKMGLETVRRGHHKPNTDCLDYFPSNDTTEVEEAIEVVETPRERNERLNTELKAAAKKVGVVATVSDWLSFNAVVWDGADFLGRIGACRDGTWRIEVNYPQKPEEWKLTPEEALKRLYALRR